MNETPPLELDIRPILEKGEEPFAAIMEAKAKLVPGQRLVVTAPFDPKPLYGIFAAEGFAVEASENPKGVWRIAFKPTPERGETPNHELDLRVLEPPEPLHRALEALARLERGRELVLHTRFRPVHLFDQLDAETTDYDCEEAGPNHWITHLWRVSA